MATDLDRLKCFLLDLDGTIYLGPKPIAGATEFLRFLRNTGRKILFFTNNPTSDALQYSHKLARMGIDAFPGEILTAGEATIRYLKEETVFTRLFVLANPSYEAELVRAGFELTDADPHAVLLAFDKTLTYAKLEKASLLLRAQIPYIATNPDLVCPTEYGYIPDCGSMAALLEAATGRVPKFIGKPNPEMVLMALRKLDACKMETAMVGDRLYTDMRMAHQSGVTAILVLSGESSSTDAENAHPKPDYIFPSVHELHLAMEQPPR